MKRITMMCVLGALALGGCQEQELPTEPLGPPSDPSFTINILHEGFHILPPVGRGHSTAGFLGTLSPRVDVCVWDGAECGAVLAFFTLHDGTGEATLRVSDDNVYEVEWDTRVVEDGGGIDFEQTYQIVVTLGGELLGTADIRFFDNGKAKSDIADEFALKDGRTLPIRFGMTFQAILGLLDADLDFPATGDFVVQTFNTDDEAQRATVPSGNAAFQVDGENVQILGNGDEFTLVIVEKALDADGTCEAVYGGPQSGGCYVFETIPAEVTFFEGGDPELPAGLAGVCPDPNTTPAFALAKFDDGETTFPDMSLTNVVTCPEFAFQGLPTFLRGLAHLVLPRPLYARDEGETGLVGGFSTIFWAVPLTIAQDPENPFEASCQISQAAKPGTATVGHPGGIGQSFEACATGGVTAIEVDVISVDDPSARLELREGAVEDEASWVASRTVEDLTLVVGSNEIVLDPPFSVVADEPFAFAFFHSEGLLTLSGGGDVYPDGELFFIHDDLVREHTPSFDLAFEITIKAPFEAGTTAEISVLLFSRHDGSPVPDGVTVLFTQLSETAAFAAVRTEDGAAMATWTVPDLPGTYTIGVHVPGTDAHLLLEAQVVEEEVIIF